MLYFLCREHLFLWKIKGSQFGRQRDVRPADQCSGGASIPRIVAPARHRDSGQDSDSWDDPDNRSELKMALLCGRDRQTRAMSAVERVGTDHADAFAGECLNDLETACEPGLPSGSGPDGALAGLGEVQLAFAIDAYRFAVTGAFISCTQSGQSGFLRVGHCLDYARDLQVTKEGFAGRV